MIISHNLRLLLWDGAVFFSEIFKSMPSFEDYNNIKMIWYPSNFNILQFQAEKVGL